MGQEVAHSVVVVVLKVAAHGVAIAGVIDVEASEGVGYPGFTPEQRQTPLPQQLPAVSSPAPYPRKQSYSTGIGQATRCYW